MTKLIKYTLTTSLAFMILALAAAACHFPWAESLFLIGLSMFGPSLLCFVLAAIGWRAQA